MGRDYLRDYFSKHHNAHGGPDDGDEAPAPSQRVQHDGQAVVYQHVTKEERAEEEVAQFPDGEDGLGVLLLLLRPRLDHDLQLSLVKSHEAEIEAGEETREAEENRDHGNHQPNGETLGSREYLYKKAECQLSYRGVKLYPESGAVPLVHPGPIRLLDTHPVSVGAAGEDHVLVQL